MRTIHLEGARALRLEVVDEADLRGGSTHVERQHSRQRQAPRDRTGENGAAGGAGLHQADRVAHRGIHRGETAARGHQQQRAAKARVAEAALQATQVARHQRLHVRVGAGRGQTLVLADLRAHLARQRDRHLRQLLADACPHPALVLGVGIAMDEADGHAFDALAGEHLDRRIHAVHIESLEHLACGTHALGHGNAQPARHQRGGPLHVDVILLEAVLVGHLHRIAESRGHQQRSLCALTLDDGVGGQRGAVNHHAHRVCGDARARQRLADALQHALLRRARRGQHLGGPGLGTAREGDIGEGAANVDGKTHSGIRHECRGYPVPDEGSRLNLITAAGRKRALCAWDEHASLRSLDSCSE